MLQIKLEITLFNTCNIFISPLAEINHFYTVTRRNSDVANIRILSKSIDRLLNVEVELSRALNPSFF